MARLIGRDFRQRAGGAGPPALEAADAHGAEAVQRVELLRLRFEENLPIRAIAERWGTDAARVCVTDYNCCSVGELAGRAPRPAARRASCEG